MSALLSIASVSYSEFFGFVSRGMRLGMRKQRVFGLPVNWNAPVALGLISVSIALLLLLGGCSSESEPMMFMPQERGDRGESCVSRNDCVQGLACVGGTCVENEYNISQEAGHCEMVECMDDSECCPDGAENCDYECQDERCVQLEDDTQCTDDFDCGFNLQCDNGHCVECLSDSECFGGDICSNGFCDAGCNVDSNCPLFHVCESNECVHSGCTSDRECAFYTGNHRATCDDGGCLVPCDNDAECNTGEFGDFQACDGGSCVFVGCETDEECRAALDMASQPDYWRARCETE